MRLPRAAESCAADRGRPFCARRAAIRLWAAAPRWALDSVRGPRLPPRGTGQPISLGTNAATLSAVSTPAFAGDREGAVTLGGSAGDTGSGGGGVGALMGYFAEPVLDGEDGRLLLLLSFGFDVVSEGLDVFGVIAVALVSEGFGVPVVSEGFGVPVVSEGFAEVSELDGAELDALDALNDAELAVSGFGSSFGFAVVVSEKLDVSEGFGVVSVLDFEVSELDELDALGALGALSGFGSSFADDAGCGGSGVAPATGVPAPDAASGAVPAPVGAAVGWFVDVATPPAAGATASAPVAAEGPACSVPGPVACACVCSCVGVCCAAGAATVPPPMVGTVTGAPVEASTVAPATVVPGANAEPGSTVAPTGVTRAGTGTASTDARNDATCVSMASAAACTSGDGACSAAESCVFRFTICDSRALVTAARSTRADVTGLTVGLVMRVSIRFSHTASRVLMVSIHVFVWACSKRVSTDCIHAVIAAHSDGGITGCPRRRGG